MVDEGDEDYLYYGTPIEREEELAAGRKRKMALDAGQMRRLLPWKQEVTDEEGRRRFHGAFTGGFSAGFYNTVGSKEGWAPRSFTSSRKNRAEVKGQTVYSFLDDDEKADFEARELSASSQFDTFGFTAAEVARKQAEKELQTRPSAIPGPVPDEIIVPVAESIGVKLLVKMGWRHGRSICASNIASTSESRREARKAFLAFTQNNEPFLSPKMVHGVEKQPLIQSDVIGDEKTDELEGDVDSAVQVPCSTPVFVIHPKNDLYGLGYDPFKNAPEFRERKYMHISQDKETGTKKTGRLHGNLFRPNAGKTATGFGIGALEDIEEEDEDIYSSGGGIFFTPEEEDEKPSYRLEPRKRTVQSQDGVLPAFKLGSISTSRVEWFIPSTVPPGFLPRHKFSVPLEVEHNLFQLPPPEAAPPHDSKLCRMIEGLATFVARSGKIFEDLSREKNANNPLFCFLFGGPGHDYYRRKLWEEQNKLAQEGKAPIGKSSERKGQKLNSEDRGRILGETPLEKSSDSTRKYVPSGDVDRLQSILLNTFTKPASLLEGAGAVQPFRSDTAKQARFEQFLKDKYQGGLRSTYIGDNSKTEIERAQERLDFEAVVETMTKGKSQKNSESANENLDLVSNVESRFTSGGVETMDSKHLEQRGHEDGEKTETKKFPQREEHQWRPSLLLCKRFNLLDPYAGKPPPLPKARSKMESLILISNPVRDLPGISSIIEGRSNLTEKSVSQSQLEAFNPDDVGEDKEEVVEAKEAIVKKPVDLYKAIFSDESDNEEEESTEKQLDSHAKNAQGANATLNRLIAGDFLESLGKELGLKVPPDIDQTQKGKDIPLFSKDSNNMVEGETAAGNGILLLANSSSQKAFERNPSPKSTMHGSGSSLIKNEEKEADAYRVGETQVAKYPGFKEENTIQHENGKSDYLCKTSTHNALKNSTSDYDSGKNKIMEGKRKREPTQERRSHSKSQRKREHRSHSDYMRKKLDRDKGSYDHKKSKKRKHRRRDSSLSSSSSESSHDS